MNFFAGTFFLKFSRDFSNNIFSKTATDALLVFHAQQFSVSGLILSACELMNWLTLPAPSISESFIEIKLELYFHTSL